MVLATPVAAEVEASAGPERREEWRTAAQEELEPRIPVAAEAEQPAGITVAAVVAVITVEKAAPAE
ncbi:MAG: hypothetical protein FJY98_02940 [Candidatus Liptonbacteria bacterium]|nr:hypothetical protein [Candidatus Liptonbacteria bacterium]